MSGRNLVVIGSSFILGRGGSFSADQVYCDVNANPGIAIDRTAVGVILSEMVKFGLVRKRGANEFRVTKKGQREFVTALSRHQES